MGAFILAGIVFAITCLWCLVLGYANSMSDAPSQSGLSLSRPFIIGTIIAALFAASHWLPHIGW